MKNHRGALAFALLAALSVGAAEPRVFPVSGEAERLARYLDYLSLSRLTEKKLDMLPAASTLCRPAAPTPPTMHGKPGIHLYANALALKDAGGPRAPGARLPIGSLVVKEKFEAYEDTTPSLITVMEKVGNAGKVDDWLFTMIRLPERTIVREPPKTSCVECHAKYTRTDYLSDTTFGLLTGYAKKRAASR